MKNVTDFFVFLYHHCKSASGADLRIGVMNGEYVVKKANGLGWEKLYLPVHG